MNEPFPLLHFITSNARKAAEVNHLLGIPVRHLALDLTEIQAASLEKIVHAKIATAKPLARPPIAVEDVSLELVALRGFPGPYVKWLMEAAGGEGLAEIARGLSSRQAVARCLVAVWDGRDTLLAEGSISGEILIEPRGSRVFGWDAWFLPSGSARTFGQMSPEEKSEHSHRARAWREMGRRLRLP